MIHNAWMTYVALVITAIQILTIPARREVCLGSHPLTLLFWKLVGVDAGSIRQTNMLNSAMLFLGRIIGAIQVSLRALHGKMRYEPSPRVAYNHAKTLWGSNWRWCTVAVLSARLVIACAAEVVRSLIREVSIYFKIQPHDLYIRCLASSQARISHLCARGTSEAANSCCCQGPCRRL